MNYHTTDPLAQMAKAQTLDDVMDAANAELTIKRSAKYDDTAPESDNVLELNPYLTDKEAEDAKKWKPLLDHEIILLHGGIGQGKNATGGMIIKKSNYYYKKKVILDFRPRAHFDVEFMPKSYDLAHRNPHGCIPIRQTDYLYFNKEEYVQQLARMSDASLGELANEALPQMETIEKKRAQELQRLSGVWMSQYGMVHMQKAIMGLGELKKYHFKMRQNDPFGIQLVYMYDIVRHLHLCILGMTAYYEDLDPNRYLPKVTVEIKCHKSELNQHTVMGEVYKVQWIEAKKNREFKRQDRTELDVLLPWALLGGTIVNLTADGEQALINLTGVNRPPDVNDLYLVLSVIKSLTGGASIFELPYRCGMKLVDVMTALMTYPDLLEMDYANTEILENVDAGRYNPIKNIRTTDIIKVKSTKGFRYLNGVAWLESEYIQYAVATDENGWSRDERGMLKANMGIPNALIGVLRRVNWRINKSKETPHKAGSPVYTGLGLGDTYNTHDAQGLPISKSMTKG